MRFLADMGISPHAVIWLCNQGHDAIHIRDEGLERFADADILAKSRQEGRIVLTSDLDFGDLLAASGELLPSVIIFRMQNMRPENVQKHLAIVLDRYSEELDRGAIFSVNERRIRVHILPV